MTTFQPAFPSSLSIRPSADRSAAPSGRDLLFGAASGLVAMGAVGISDAVLSQFVSEEQERRERRVREGSPHDVAGPRFAGRLLGREPTRTESLAAKGVFTVLYGLLWGVVYAAVRRVLPGTRRLAGLPFAVPFFVACDGGIAPLLGLTPGLQRIPWQFNAKELANHVVWTAAAELALSALERRQDTR